MPKPLTSAQVETLRSELIALEAFLRDAVELSAGGAQVVQLDQAAMGRVSRIDAIQQQKMVSAGREANKIRLSQIRRALRSLAADEYGDCLECGEPIGFGRLTVSPESPFCVKCQGAREKR